MAITLTPNNSMRFTDDEKAAIVRLALLADDLDVINKQMSDYTWDSGVEYAALRDAHEDCADKMLAAFHELVRELRLEGSR